MKQGVELPEASFNETPICDTFVVVSRKKDPLNQFWAQSIQGKLPKRSAEPRIAVHEEHKHRKWEESSL